MDEWSRLRFAMADTVGVLSANATRIRALIEAGTEETESLQQALEAIEAALVELENADPKGLVGEKRGVWR